MKAVVLVEPYKLELRELPIPSLSKDEVLIRVRAAAICTTDLEIYRGKISVPFPLVLGHEIAGEVVAIGEAVSRINIGDKVIVRPGGMIGRVKNGGFAEYVSAPERLVYHMPENITYEEGALIELLWTVYHGHKRANIKSNQSVAIIGLGASGFLHASLAKIAGANPIIGISRSEFKLELAKKIGCDIVINPIKKDVVKEIMEITKGKGVDTVIEAAGEPETFELSFELVRYGGTILQFGVITDPIKEFNAYKIYEKELTIIGSRGMLEEEYQDVYNIVSKKMIDLSSMVTLKISLDDVPEIFKQLDKQQLKAIRVIITS